MKKLGWVGVGAMGFPMVQALLDHELAVKVYDVNLERIDALRKMGAEGVDDLENQPFDDVDVLGIMVQNYAQCRELLLDRRVLDTLQPGAVLMVFGTIGAQAIREIEQWAKARSIAVLDAPVSGGPQRARGHLSIMFSGEATTVERTRGILEVLGGTLIPVGDQVGQGQTVKMINQLLAGVHIAAAAEALTLAQKAGIETQLAYDVVIQSAGNSWMFQDRGPRMLSGEYLPARSALEIFVKDLGIVQDAARDLEMPLFLAPAAFQMFLGGRGQGLSQWDDSAVIEVYQRLAGFEKEKTPKGDG